jgi:hypothetical protein
MKYYAMKTFVGSGCIEQAKESELPILIYILSYVKVLYEE